MKTIYSILFVSLFLVSCGGENKATLEEVIATNDLQKIRAKKSELDQQKLALQEEIKLLNNAIAKLDTIKKVSLVTAIELKEELFSHYLEIQGDVKTKQNVLIYPEMAGTLETVKVKEGQKVAKGQILAVIDDGGMANQVAQLEAQVSLAKTTFERQKNLWEQKIGSEIQYLQSKTNYESLSNQLAQLKSQIDKFNIRAPFSGIIDDVIKDQGNVVAPGPGSEIFRIINLNNMYLEADVPETYIAAITPGKDVEIYFPVLGETVTTKVRQTGNFINPANRTFRVEITVPNTKGNIKPNLTAKIKINDYTSENAILIPQSIISENAAGDQYVYRVEKNNNKNIAKQTIVTTGKTQGDVIEILKGVSTGDLLIQAGARSVKDGQEIKIASN